jgi:hypothetical protein
LRGKWIVIENKDNTENKEKEKEKGDENKIIKAGQICSKS